MSNLLKAYSQYCDVNPTSPPEFPSTFIPLPEGEYITVCTGSRFPAGIYDYYNKALSLVNLPCKIVQIGAAQDYQIFGAVDYRGKANLREEAFIIENGLLHIGNDHVFQHIAAAKQILAIGLYSVVLAKCSASPWYPQHTLEPEGKPSYIEDESPKRINGILPESVAKLIGDCLQVSHERIKTIKIGNQYNFEQIDLVPDFAIPLDIFKGRRIVCRYDLCPNREALIHFLQAYGGPILTEDPIDPQILMGLKDRVPQIVYFLDKNYSKEFVHFLHYSGIPYELVTSKREKALSDLKLELFNYNQLKSRTPPDTEGITKEMFFETKRAFFSRGKWYPTAWHLSEGITMDECDYKIGEALNSKKFLDSWSNFYIYEKTV